MKTKLLALAILLSLPSLARADLVTNGGFEILDGDPAKGFVYATLPHGWSGGDTSVTLIDAPGTADDGELYSVYGPFPATSPDGGNFLAAEADDTFPDPIYQTINGLTVGQDYYVSFYQAAGQDNGHDGPTTSQWKVSFGSQTQSSDLFSLPDKGIAPWEKQTMTFTATSTSQVLSFLTSGGPEGSPPFIFLDGVSVVAAPLPNAFLSTVALMVGLMGVQLLGRRRSITAAKI